MNLTETLRGHIKDYLTTSYVNRNVAFGLSLGYFPIFKLVSPGDEGKWEHLHSLSLSLRILHVHDRNKFFCRHWGVFLNLKPFSIINYCLKNIVRELNLKFQISCPVKRVPI